MQKVILVLQSKSTGRFLLGQKGDQWNWTSSRFNDPEVSVMYKALEDMSHLLVDPLCHDDISIEIVSGTRDYVFHVWIDGEPQTHPDGLWASLLSFPSNCHPDIDMLFGNAHFRDVTVRPDS